MLHETKLLPNTGEATGFTRLDDKNVVFLLGTDYFIGAPTTHEQRVAITPDQAGALKTWLADLGINLDLYVFKGTGERAGFPDSDFEAVGGKIIVESEIPSMPAPDLVHALKEPTDYEADIPGRYMRIGALHTGDFRPGCGLAKVLLKSDFCGIFDGSAVGGFAYKGDFEVKPKFRVPLRSSMSVYAGWLAGEDVGDSLGQNERVIISGGGVVGTSAADVLLEKHEDQLDEILIIEKFPERCAVLKEMYKDHPCVKIQEGFDIKDEDLKGAQGLILTIFVQGSAATPKVTSVEQVSLMKKGGHIVDVAIDEGGGIQTSRDGEIDPETGRERIVPIEEIRAEVTALGRDLHYFADNHMPRRRPHEASIEHGKTALPYLATLLYYSAACGSSTDALMHIMDQDYIEEPKTIAQALVLDLKHGLAFSSLSHTIALYRHVLKRAEDIQHFLAENEAHSVFV